MADTDIAFSRSAPLTMGVELELQILNTRDYNLARGATDLLTRIGKRKSPHPGDIKPEITESMIEISTAVHERHDSLHAELIAIRDVLVENGDRLNLSLCGGGAHPFQQWSERRIYDTPRFRHVSELYGYLAKQFTVFGQHIHIGCANGDDALYLTHALSRYIPHFIALSAASPFYQGQDTAFDSSRLTAVNAFPLSGRAPFVLKWSQFEEYFAKMRGFGIVESMKDFYWDIRPKPEFGTIEIRVCDTPLTIGEASALAGYAQALCRHLLNERREMTTEDIYLVYNYNRFQACRFGLDGEIVDPDTRQRAILSKDIIATLGRLGRDGEELGAGKALDTILAVATSKENGARWMREALKAGGSLPDVVRMQSARWRSAD